MIQLVAATLLAPPILASVYILSVAYYWQRKSNKV